MGTPTDKPVGGPIKRGEIYPYKEALRRLGWGRAAYRKAVANGLKKVPVHGRVYLSGNAICDYIEGLEG